MWGLLERTKPAASEAGFARSRSLPWPAIEPGAALEMLVLDAEQMGDDFVDLADEMIGERMSLAAVFRRTVAAGHGADDGFLVAAG